MEKKTRTYKDYKEEVLEQLKKGLEEDPLYLLKIANRKTPHNPITNKYYRGINFVECAIVSHVRGYKDSRWYTMNNIKNLGLRLKAKDPSKGYQSHDQSATELMYFIPFFLYDLDANGKIDWKNGKQISQKEYENLSDEDKARCKSKTIKWWVYNGDQIEGLEPEYCEEKGYSISLANHIADSLGTSIEWDSNKENPCYSSRSDKIYMPDSNAFDNENEMNAVALHELSHSTGHKSRLDRKLGNVFGSEEYAFEELIAECSATMLCAYLGIEPIVHDNHKAYVNSWLGVLNDNKNALLDAFKMAEKAQQYIIDTSHLETYGETVSQTVSETEEEPVKETRKTKKTETKKQIASLNGLNIVITGRLNKYGRKTAFKLIEAKGGTPSDSLTLKTDYLIVADEKVGSATGKIKKAQEYGTKILSENEFYAMLAV